MPSKNSNDDGIKVLLGKRDITTEEWIKLIEFRVGLIKPFLNKITLQPLGNMNSGLDKLGVENLYGLSKISRKIPTLSNLNVQGFFKIISCWPEIGENKGVFNFWGLTRTAEWMHIEMEIGTSPITITKFLVIDPESVNYWFDNRLLHPRLLFLSLGEFFENAMKERDRLYKEMEEIHKIMERENNLIPFVLG